MSTRRVKPGGYACQSKIDNALMLNADILHDLETVLSSSVNKEEFYRIIAKTINNIHKSNMTLKEIQDIFKNNDKE